MRITLIILLFFSFKSHAQTDISPDMTMKARLRLHLWAYGIVDKTNQNKKVSSKKMPEQLWKPLRKI